MAKKSILIVKSLLLAVIFILFLSNVRATDGVDISFEIITYDIQDAFVVGDSFYYKIYLTNKDNETITKEFTVQVYNSQGPLEETPKKYQRSILPGKTVTIMAEGGSEGETAAFPFDISREYKISISAEDIDFKRVLRTGKYIRWSNQFNYYFDVMPSWQYDLWQDEKNISDNLIKATGNLIIYTFILILLTALLVFVEVYGERLKKFIRGIISFIMLSIIVISIGAIIILIISRFVFK